MKMTAQKQKMSMRTVHFSLTLSTITFIRKILPPSDFKNHSIGDENGDLEYREIVAGDFMPYVKSCIDALEKNYLKKVLLAIKVDNSIVEIYEINVSDLVREENNNSELINSLNLLKKSLKRLMPLPKYKKLTLKLILESPTSYSLPGFENIKNHEFEIKANEKREIIEHDLLNIITIYKQNEEGIRCACKYYLTDGPMIFCDKCHNWMHTICAGFFSNNDKRIPEKYFCFSCENFNEEKEYFLATKRKIIHSIFNEKISTLAELYTRYGCSKQDIAKIVEELVVYNIIVRKHKRLYPNCDVSTKEKIKKIFSLVKKKELILIEDIVSKQ